MRGIVAGCAGAAFGAVVLLSTPALAQFPPQGAVADPDNPAFATRTITESRLGASATIIRRYYYDCGKKRWVLVGTETSFGITAPPVPSSYPPGPPPGSRREPGDPNRAFNPTTGQNFVHHKGQWIDVKNGQVIPEPKLCPEPEHVTTPQPPPAPPPPPPPPQAPPRQVGMVPPRIGGGPYGGLGLGTLVTNCPNWTTTGIDSLGSSDPVKPDNQACYSTGFLVTPYVGYQWSLASGWLAGVEGDFGYATNSATTGVPGVSSAPGDTVSVKEDWNGSLRARLGYAVAPNVVVYGTTGLALQHLEASVTCSSATPFPCGRFGAVTAMTATSAPTLAGWTIGAGVEYALTGNLRLRAEYRYSDYGTYDATYGNPANVAVSSAIKLQTNTALLGLTYAFGAPPVPPSPPPLIRK